MAPSNVTIKIDFETFVKVSCDCVKCEHNLGRILGMYCNLKRIDIGVSGVCLARCVPERAQAPDQAGSPL